MATNINTNPFPLGKLLPGSTTAAVKISSALSGVDSLAVRQIEIQASPGNSTGIIYILSTSAQPDTTNYTNIIKALSAGQSWTLTSQALNGLVLGSLWIGASDNSSFAFGNFVQA